MERLCVLAGICLTLLGPVRTISALQGAAVHLSESKVSGTQAPSSTKKVYVKGYYRKDGTYVPPHWRAAPGSGAGTSGAKPPAKFGGNPSGSPAPNPAPGSTGRGCQTCPRDSKGRIIHSEAAKKEFMKETGYPSGRPGYVVDHIIPLECGGADDPSNMQWQTAAEAKAKDKTESNCRK